MMFDEDASMYQAQCRQPTAVGNVSDEQLIEDLHTPQPCAAHIFQTKLQYVAEILLLHLLKSPAVNLAKRASSDEILAA